MGPAYIIAEWLFNFVQVFVLVGIWETMKLLWRIATGNSRLTEGGNPCRVRKMKLKHVVIAMNPVTGMSLVRHKKLPRTQTVIVCNKDDVAQLLEGQDIHDLSIHVAGDAINIPLDTAMFFQVLKTCTNH